MVEPGDEKKNVAMHILPTAANLLGICFLIFSFINVLKLQNETLIDELVAVTIVVFLVASVASYASLRSERTHLLYRKTADIFFLIGLCFLTLAAIAIVLKIIV